jgi:hypothetical protein
VKELAHGALGTDDQGYRRELIGLVAIAQKLSPSAAIAR